MTTLKPVEMTTDLLVNLSEAAERDFAEKDAERVFEATFASWGVYTSKDVPVLYAGVIRPQLIVPYGMIWLILTKEFERRPLGAIRCCKRLMAELMLKYDVIHALIKFDAEREAKFAKRLGFKELQPFNDKYNLYEVANDGRS